ncbi:hypothetical protein BDY17DRAFT_244578 [Neohortaea acidophila]|uniref:Ubiquitin-like protease family profile domain-containing protein n=1 Tax=Neohortaea acidophila TaxID=245834 RepID=A0A6A6Q7Z5_9PEZI|nr:uncharacterized protein BDY17DRAFT_244578 [Neohortaea acidophila]KAF2488169.1 hypothetical protein BDY17DRAFT_244578 [Neohortaea acidophila]
MAAKSKDTVVATTVDGTEISRHDLESLIRKPGVKSQPWLNDEIVNGIMAAIVGRKLEQTGWAKGSKTAPAYAYLPSMWYSNYQKPGGVNNIASWTRRRGIKGAKLLEAEKVFFPVNTGVHWMLLIISPQARTIEFLDSFNFGLHSKAWMFQIAREWLAMELEGKYVAEEWTELASESCPQSNSDDCGAFTCFNALAAGKGLGFEAVGGGHMADARKMLAAVLVNGGFKGDFEL